VIETLLPGEAVVIEAFDVPPGAVLFPEERALVAQAVDKRVREFTAVRHCARVALARLDVPPAPILPGPYGEPGWPDGIVGSMTHCDGYCAAAVARSSHLASLGVDAEPHEPLPADVLNTVALPTEQRRLVELAAERPEVCWDRLLFSAKEAVYKTWYPLTRQWLDFDGAEISFEPDTFYARLRVPGPIVGGVRLSGFSGRWKVQDGLLFTAISLRAPRAYR
jgi:4'-phosphopantetheinyl transferase EntD